MGEKDIAEKTLLAYNDVFADIVNVLLFDGECIVAESDLEEQSSRSAYKVDGKLHDVDRDVAKRWRSQNIRIACFGLENQSEPEKYMPLRVISYDGMEYRAQMLKSQKIVQPGKSEAADERASKTEKAKMYPVITLVLYFGYKNHWTEPTHLIECLEIPEGLEKYVNDYRINVFEIAYLEPEKVMEFQSDFRIVADYFVQMRMNKRYQPEGSRIKHVQEVLQLLAIMTGDHRFEDVFNDDGPWKRGGMTMCEFWDEIENRGIEKGKVEGRVEGESLILSLMSRLLSAGRFEDAKKATLDQEFCRTLLMEMGLVQ